MKIWVYTFMIVFIAIFLTMAGIDVPAANNILELAGVDINQPANINSETPIYQAIFGSGTGLLITILLTSITVGLLTRSKSENYAILPLIIGTGAGGFGLYMFVSLFWSLTSIAFGYAYWVGFVTALLLIPLGFAYIVALVEFFRGTD